MTRPSPGFTVSYAKVEAALVRMHNVDAAGVSAFRSRFGALQRGGMLGNQPGKGRRLEYGPDQIHRAVLAFELVQAGIAPSIILTLINEYWDSRLQNIFTKAEHANARGTSDVVLMLAGIAALSPERAITNINATTMNKIPNLLALALEGDSLPGRALLVNLSAQLRNFHAALVDLHLMPDHLIGVTSIRAPAKRRRDRPR